jgi:hypothetical protein
LIAASNKELGHIIKGNLTPSLAYNMHISVVIPLLESPVILIEAFDGHRWDSPQKLGRTGLTAGGREIRAAGSSRKPN